MSVPGGGRVECGGREYYISINVLQNYSAVKDPQYLSDSSISWQKRGKNRPEPARQPYKGELKFGISQSR